MIFGRYAAKTCGILKQVCMWFYFCHDHFKSSLPLKFISITLRYVCKLFLFSLEKPPAPTRVQLVRASTTTLEVCWGSVPTGMLLFLLSHLLVICGVDNHRGWYSLIAKGHWDQSSSFAMLVLKIYSRCVTHFSGVNKVLFSLFKVNSHCSLFKEKF